MYSRRPSPWPAVCRPSSAVRPQTSQNVKTLPDYGMSIKYPPNPSVLDRFVQLLKLIHKNWRAKRIVLALTPQQRLVVRRKIYASGIFKGDGAIQGGRSKGPGVGREWAGVARKDVRDVVGVPEAAANAVLPRLSPPPHPALVHGIDAPN